MIISTKLENIANNLGGKANSLIKLTINQIPVPQFLVVSAVEFKEFLDYNKITKIIMDLFNQDDYKQIKQTILSGKFPKKLENDILQNLKLLNIDECSVRSSASNEDGVKKSFAGQYETFLNITPPQVFEAIKKCWCSLFDSNVIAYTGKDNMNIYGMNVVIQRMINPNYAGVAFSKNPVSRSNNYSVVEICRGNGEKLVSGQTTPTQCLIRRQTGAVDLTIGKKFLDDELLKELETYILKIEEIYQTPMDIEWCVQNNEIFIVQARPITAFSKSCEPYIKTLTREKNLFELEILSTGEYNGINKLTNNLYYQLPLIEFRSLEQTRFYYNAYALEELPSCIFRELDNNFNAFKKYYQKVKTCCDYLNNILLNKLPIDQNNFKEIINKLITIQPFSSLGNLVGQNWPCSDRVKDILVDYRKKYDTIIYKTTGLICKNKENLVSKKLLPYWPVLSIKEILNPESSDISQLKQRLNGFIYFKDKIYYNSLEEFLKLKNYSIKKPQTDNQITGKSAFAGVVKGKVKVVLSTKDFAKFENNDILVTSMTTPKFTEIMQKSSGIITDEGGFTCHAAIVARELKKPCLVGCKNATSTLKDGMTIELDTINCKVKIIK